MSSKGSVEHKESAGDDAAIDAALSGGQDPFVSYGSALVQACRDIGARLLCSSQVKHSDFASPPLFASYLTRTVSLQLADQGKLHFTQPTNSAASTNSFVALTPASVELLYRVTHEQLVAESKSLHFHTLHLQCVYEHHVHATAVAAAQFAHNERTLLQRDIGALVAQASAQGGLSSNAQVTQLYRSLFALVQTHGCLDASLVAHSAKSVQRELAAAIESVFPQSSLNAFNLAIDSDKALQLHAMTQLVLGIRLFNKHLGKGGAGLQPAHEQALQATQQLYARLELEQQRTAECLLVLDDVIDYEHVKPRSVQTPMTQLLSALLYQRQVSAQWSEMLQSVLVAIDTIQSVRDTYLSECDELATMIDLHAEIEKEAVYPKFTRLAVLYRQLLALQRQHDAQLSRLAALKQHSGQSACQPDILEADLDMVRNWDHAARQKQQDASKIDFDAFVKTPVNVPALTGQGPPTAVSPTCIRLTASTCSAFLTLPLEYQGFCCVTMVQSQGHVTPGLPSQFGVVQLLDRYYAFRSVDAMRAFCTEPERFTSGIVQLAVRRPALIHLAQLQQQMAHTDINEFIEQSELDLDPSKGLGSLQPVTRSKSGAVQAHAGSQTATHINTDIPDPHYHWNEWYLRRQALHMADLQKAATHSTQTHESHFKRENSTQYTLPKLLADGTMQGVGTMTRIEKSTNSERTHSILHGTQGAKDSKVRIVQLQLPSTVTECTNPRLAQKRQNAHSKQR